MASFSQLVAVKKDTIFGAAQTKLGPSYFVRALISTIFGAKVQKLFSEIKQPLLSLLKFLKNHFFQPKLKYPVMLTRNSN